MGHEQFAAGEVQPVVASNSGLWLPLRHSQLSAGPCAERFQLAAYVPPALIKCRRPVFGHIAVEHQRARAVDERPEVRDAAQGTHVSPSAGRIKRTGLGYAGPVREVTSIGDYLVLPLPPPPP